MVLGHPDFDRSKPLGHIPKSWEIKVYKRLYKDWYFYSYIQCTYSWYAWKYIRDSIVLRVAKEQIRRNEMCSGVGIKKIDEQTYINLINHGVMAMDRFKLQQIELDIVHAKVQLEMYNKIFESGIGNDEDDFRYNRIVQDLSKLTDEKIALRGKK